MAHGRILFINASQKRDGNTVEYAQALLDGLDFERIDLVDYRMGFFGQDFADDQFEEVFQKMVESDTIVLGSPVYSETMSAAARPSSSAWRPAHRTTPWQAGASRSSSRATAPSR